MKIPIVYNCSGYEKVETLETLKDTVDIYLTDFKYMEEGMASRYSGAPDYPQVAKKKRWQKWFARLETLFLTVMV